MKNLLIVISILFSNTCFSDNIIPYIVGGVGGIVIYRSLESHDNYDHHINHHMHNYHEHYYQPEPIPRYIQPYNRYPFVWCNAYNALIDIRLTACPW